MSEHNNDTKTPKDKKLRYESKGSLVGGHLLTIIGLIIVSYLFYFLVKKAWESLFGKTDNPDTYIEVYVTRHHPNVSDENVYTLKVYYEKAVEIPESAFRYDFTAQCNKTVKMTAPNWAGPEYIRGCSGGRDTIPNYENYLNLIAIRK